MIQLRPKSNRHITTITLHHHHRVSKILVIAYDKVNGDLILGRNATRIAKVHLVHQPQPQLVKPAVPQQPRIRLSSADGKYKLSVNDFLIKAIAVASMKVPAVNASWRGDSIRQFSTVDVSVAVSTPTGLITPIVTGVEGRGLESISNKVKELAKKARDQKLKPEEYQGGSISISNMGMNDAVDHFSAVINPPQAAIIAIGTTKKAAVPVENEDGTTGVEFEDQITITASFDHKVVDGVVGAEWVREFKKVIENPLDLLL